MSEARSSDPATAACHRLSIPQVLVPIAVLVGVGAAFLASAWVCDDAFIVFRTIDNLLAGHGLCFNVGERVQSYTSPLWLFLNILPYFVFGDVIVAATVAAYAVWMATWILIARRHLDRPLVLLCLLAVPLLSTKSVVDYASSGLETPLVFLLIVAFYCVLVKPKDSLFPLALIAGVSGVTRLDAVVILIPSLLLVLFEHRRGLARTLGLLVAGLSPLIVWLLFSIVYYGFFLPNTYYAKLTTGIRRADYISQGFLYVGDLIRRDSASCVLIAVGLLLALISALRSVRRSWRQSLCPSPEVDQRIASLGIGVLAHVCYVIWVGGDFMSGRFWSPCVLTSALILAERCASSRYGTEWSLRNWFLWLGLGIALCSVPGRLLPMPVVDPATGIADERAVYFSRNGYLNYALADRSARGHPFIRRGEGLKERARSPRGQRVVVSGWQSGMTAYAAGAGVHFVTGQALWDPLLARLPVRDRTVWRIGHFTREIPKGYVRAVTSGDMAELDEDLRGYYGPLQHVASGPLWDLGRLWEACKLNLGFYNEYRDRYIARCCISPEGPRRQASLDAE